jgi:hypothetical protein
MVALSPVGIELQVLAPDVKDSLFVCLSYLFTTASRVLP